ncbi:MAG TPA: GNAT family N-acetyltransferase [Pyrinomonadaceae bacterium]|jgi:ribosomal-protein-alanine N-acetyltransferase|nr:GNAT family N-acetyltransferase [Pyrinomonadaceae bacterium]
MVASLRQDVEQPEPFVADRLETARLRFRMFTPADLDDMHLITRDPEVMYHIADGHTLTREETEENLERIICAFRRRGFGRWALVRKKTGALVGYCGLTLGSEEVGVELAYMLAKSEWGKGLATEAASATLRYGFETLGLGVIAGLTRPENARSRHVMERLNMKHIRDWRYHGYSCTWYALAREEWRPDGSLYRVIQ